MPELLGKIVTSPYSKSDTDEVFRWFSGCFCWRTSISRKFSIEAELQFVIAFGNSIMAEVRLNRTP